ncbi:nitroreductase family protein [Chlorobium sp. KB01]|uniref:nitroreductase family protein n=1 Tax=Chlorobium sp. KB01 TaxID=1917528 RepID=UPI000976D425|nr:nitroreductase family protein [Chlorobium sp. KB01]
MDFYDLVTRRSSIRSFDGNKAIPEEVLRRILNAGRVAPSAKNLQPWRFLVVRSLELLQKIYPAYPRDWIQSAPALLIVTGRRDQAWVRSKDGYNSLETDLTIAMDHLILAAAWEGIGTCWIAAFDPAILHEALHLDESDEIFAFTPLGYPAPDALPMQKNRKALEEIVEFL